MNKVYVVGIGPGGADQITPRAREAMNRAEVLCGSCTQTRRSSPPP